MRCVLVDDLRDTSYIPFHDTQENTMEWTICRSSQQAKTDYFVRGLPALYAFDHDLGGEDTVPAFLRYLLEETDCVDKEPPSYLIVSDNSAGVPTIHSLMNSWARLAGGEMKDAVYQGVRIRVFKKNH